MHEASTLINRNSLSPLACKNLSDKHSACDRTQKRSRTEHRIAPGPKRKHKRKRKRQNCQRFTETQKRKPTAQVTGIMVIPEMQNAKAKTQTPNAKAKSASSIFFTKPRKGAQLVLRPCRTAKLRNCWQTANCQTAPKTPASSAGLGTVAAETSSTEPSLIIAARSGARVKSGLGCHIRCAKRGSPWNGPSAESQAGALLSPENKTKGEKNCHQSQQCKENQQRSGWLAPVCQPAAKITLHKPPRLGLQTSA